MLSMLALGATLIACQAGEPAKAATNAQSSSDALKKAMIERGKALELPTLVKLRFKFVEDVAEEFHRVWKCRTVVRRPLQFVVDDWQKGSSAFRFQVVERLTE